MNQPAVIRDNSALARPKNARPLPITPAIRTAIEAMVNDGDDLQRAAAKAGLSTRHLRVALGKPHVAAFLKVQTQVLLTARRPRNIHRLCEIADAANNMPAVNAIKALEQVDDNNAMKSTNAATPGVTVRIVNIMPSENAKVIEHDDTSR